MAHQIIRAVDERGKYRDTSLKHGDLGNFQALDPARNFILRANQDEAVRALALRIVAGVKGHDPEGELDALYVYVRDQITYRRDPRGQERVQDARFTLRTRSGDCLDKVILFCGLAGSLGYVTRFHLLMQRQTKEGGFDHIYADGKVPNEWKAYDATPEQAWAGWRGHGLRETTVAIYTPSEALQLSGWLSKLVGIGGIVAAPFTGGASLFVTAATGTASSLIGAHEASAAQAKEAGKVFEQMSTDAANLYHSLAGKQTLTQAEYDQAAQAYSQLEQLAQQASGVKYVAQKWADPNYGPSFRSQLESLRARVQGAAAVGNVAGGAAAAGAGAGSSAAPLLIVGGLAAFYFLSR